MNKKSLIDLPEYWNRRYSENNDSWTLNSANPVFVQLLSSKKISLGNKMLVLGCGTGCDAFAAAELGYEVTGIDFSSEALSIAVENSKLSDNPPKYLNMDFFELKNTGYIFDTVYEYVSFCSVVPCRLEELISNIHSVTAENGLLISVLFPINNLNYAPPNSIDYIEFVNTAAKYFRLIYFQRNINSIKPRKGKEVLLIFKKTG